MADNPESGQTIEQLMESDHSPGRFVAVPDSLREAIDARLDAAIAKRPAAAKDRDALYNQLLWYFSEYGSLPEFSIELKDGAP